MTNPFCKIITVLICCILFSVDTAFAQSEKASDKIIADKIENFYNQNKYDSIFAMLSNSMQTFLPSDKNNAFFTKLKLDAGQFTSKSFIKYKGGIANYKTSFERGIFMFKISVDSDLKINGFQIVPFTNDSLPKIKRNTTALQLPFKGEWTVVWGGDTKELNYHVESVAQKNAFDIVITDAKGQSYKTNGKTNEDYYAFGKELLAPCDGEVVLVVDGVKDNQPGDLNPIYVPGNTVILKTINNEYLFFAHFKQHSIKVTQGQKIKQGAVLGQCGNSGNSSEPHLHFHIQNVENMNIATGAKCYFDNLLVNGLLKKDYSPIQKDKISPLK